MCSCSFKFSIQRAGEGLGILNDKVKNSRGGEREKKEQTLVILVFISKLKQYPTPAHLLNLILWREKHSKVKHTKLYPSKLLTNLYKNGGKWSLIITKYLNVADFVKVLKR